MKKAIVIVLIILIALFILVVVWSVSAYARPIQFGDLKIKVVPESNKVFVKSENAEFQEITAETELKLGDAIKTDETGEARIILFDTNEVTLGKNSEVVLEESFIDGQTPFLTKIKLNLKQGQIWSRLLEFLNPDAYFEVEAGGVVATVRGTVFNFLYQEGDVVVSVLEGEVAVVKGTEKPSMLKVDENFILEEGAIKAKFGKIEEATKQSSWFKNNFKRDQDFKEEIKEKRDKILEQVGPLPGSATYPLKVLGEKMSLALTFDKSEKQNKINNFEMRKILEARLLWGQGDKTKALQIIKSVPEIREAWSFVKRFDYYDREFLKIKDEDFSREYLKGILTPKELEFVNKFIEIKIPILEEELIVEPSEVPPELVNCAAGAYMDTPEGRGQIIGLESHEIQGEIRPLCCTELESNIGGEIRKVKVCCGSTTDVKLSITLMYDEVKGQYIRVSEVYPKNGQSCVRMFNPETGAFLTEMCY